MKRHELLTFSVAVVISLVAHVALFSWLFQVRFHSIDDFEKEVRKRFNLKEVAIQQLKTHVEALPVPSTKTFRYENVAGLTPKPVEVESVRQSMQTLQLEPNPPGTPLLPKGNEPAIQMTAPQQQVQVSDTHEKIKQEVIAIQETKLKENRPTIDPSPRANAQADIVERAGREDKRTPDEIRNAPGVLTGGEGDPLNASLSAAAAGIGLRDSLSLRKPETTAATNPIEDKPYESIEEWLNVEVFTHEDPTLDGEQAFYHVRITTKPNHPLRIIPKDVIFVIDASASITQEKLDYFARSVTRVLTLLNPIDRFNIVSFSDKPLYLRQQMMPVTAKDENDVRILLGTIKSQGATDLYGALSPLMNLQPSPGRLLMLFLLSDGKPTEGIVDSAAIINRISDVNSNRATIFDFGGPTANRYLLDLLAFRNRGDTHFAEKLGDMEQSFVDLYSDVRNPLLMNLQFQFSGADSKLVFPQALPHLYQDTSLDLYGRYNPKTQKTFAFRLVGETYNEKKELFVTKEFPAPDPSRTYMPTQWAQRKIYQMIGDLVKRDTPESRQQILQLGTTYKIKVPYIKAEK
jgi:hypothetical protein